MYITVFNTNNEITKEKLPFNEAGKCSIDIEALPGTLSGLHIEISNLEGTIVARKEIATEAKEQIPINFILKDDQLKISSPGRNIISLPTENIYGPIPAISNSSPTEPVDLMVIIDGTSVIYNLKDPKTRPLLGDNEKWNGVVGQINDLLRLIVSDRSKHRSIFLAFGDTSPPEVAAKDLVPKYHLYPDIQDIGQRLFEPLKTDKFHASLRSIPKTSGGDFVDALADALHVANEMHWRPEARKLVFIFGDSPGHSITSPSPDFANLGVRKNDVDSETLRLHKAGVEVITIYNDPPKEFEKTIHQGDIISKFISFSKNQYKRLATLPEYSFSLSKFQHEKAFNVMQNRYKPLTRGANYGYLLKSV